MREGGLPLLLRCAGCAGSFVPPVAWSEWIALLQVRGQEPLAKLSTPVAEAPLSSTEKFKFIPCPVCKRELERASFDGVGPVIDICPNHGSWFDGEELRGTLSYLQSRLRKSGNSQRPDPHTGRLALQHALTEAKLRVDFVENAAFELSCGPNGESDEDLFRRAKGALSACFEAGVQFGTDKAGDIARELGQ